MKKQKLILKNAIALILFITIGLSSYGQYSDEVNKMLGIEPNDRPKIEMENISNLPSDTILFITDNEEVSFRFTDNLLTTTLKDQMKRIRFYNIYDEDEDKEHKWTTYECKDNSGSIMYFTIGKEKNTDKDLFVLDYGSFKFQYELTRTNIPEEKVEVLDKLDESGYFGDGEFGSEYTDEEVMEFLSLFGDSSILLNLMLRELYFSEDFGVNNKPQEWQKGFGDKATKIIIMQ